MTLYIIVGITSIVLVLGLFFLNNYFKLKELNNFCNVSQERLFEVLNKKKNLLEKLKDQTKNKNLIKLLNIEENLDVFQLEKALFDVRWNLNKLIEEEKIKIKKESKTIITSLNEIEDEIEGLKDYYNSKAITYNEKYFKKPFYFLFKLFKLEDKKTFSLRKIENYEILKD